VRVAVVGGGLFGATAAVELARNGAQVTLYERHRNLLMGATRANQGRIHRGYHYPRDPRAKELSRHADRLAARFPTAVIRANIHRYLIAVDSQLTDADYFRFCVTSGLQWNANTSPLIRPDTVTARIAVPESFLDIAKTRTLLCRELVAAGVHLRLGELADIVDLSGRYDRVVDATYGRHWPDPLRYEVCETALVELGRQYRGQSFVVMDGEFVSLDPHGDVHMLYDVKHSVHAVDAIPDHLAPLLDRGPVHTEHTRVGAMLDTARRYLRRLDAVYRGSLFTIRAVLPDDGTDARPTLIRRDGNITRVLAGKLCTAPWAAEQVASREAVPA
jgi:hypothetical protein